MSKVRHVTDEEEQTSLHLFDKILNPMMSLDDNKYKISSSTSLGRSLILSIISVGMLWKNNNISINNVLITDSYCGYYHKNDPANEGKNKRGYVLYLSVIRSHVLILFNFILFVCTFYCNMHACSWIRKFMLEPFAFSFTEKSEIVLFCSSILLSI